MSSSSRRVSKHKSTIPYKDLTLLLSELQYLKNQPGMKDIASKLDYLITNVMEDVQVSNRYKDVIKKYKPGMLKFDLSQLALERVRGKLWRSTTNKNFVYELFKKVPRSTLEEIVLEPSDIKVRNMLYNVRDRILKRYLRHIVETKKNELSHWLYNFWYGYDNQV